MDARSLTTYLRDLGLYLLGCYIAMSEVGVPPFQRPPHGPSVMVLVFAGLLCNGPVVLQALQLRFGTGSSRPPEQLPPPEPSSEPSSAASSGGS